MPALIPHAPAMVSHAVTSSSFSSFRAPEGKGAGVCQFSRLWSNQLWQKPEKIGPEVDTWNVPVMLEYAILLSNRCTASAVFVPATVSCMHMNTLMCKLLAALYLAGGTA